MVSRSKVEDHCPCFSGLLSIADICAEIEDRLWHDERLAFTFGGSEGMLRGARWKRKQVSWGLIKLTMTLSNTWRERTKKDVAHIAYCFSVRPAFDLQRPGNAIQSEEESVGV
jgi:hypothetical protein